VALSERRQALIPCPECGKECDGRRGLGSHLRKTHGIAGPRALERTEPCPICGVLLRPGARALGIHRSHRHGVPGRCSENYQRRKRERAVAAGPFYCGCSSDAVFDTRAELEEHELACPLIPLMAD
jgi:hypothetical protein